MRTRIMLALACLVLAALNYGLFAMQDLRDNGHVVYLELNPNQEWDLPFIDGEFVPLRFRITDELIRPPKLPRNGFVVVRMDQNNIAYFQRFHDGSPLQKGEFMIRYRLSGGARRVIRILPATYFIHSDHEKLFRQPKYGVFHFGNNGEYLLAGLADANRELIRIPEWPQSPVQGHP